MVYVLSRKTIAKEKQGAFLEMAKELVALTRQEEGCASYALTAQRGVDNQLIYIERWESQAHLDAHQASEHFARLVPALNAMCEEVELTVWDDAFEAAGM